VTALPAVPNPPVLLSRGTLIGFDFDGTLVPIASTPQSIHPDPRLPTWLARAAARHPLIICTGRGLDGLRQHVPDTRGLELIGNHGAERATWTDTGLRAESLAPPEWWVSRDELAREVSDELGRRGGRLEDKRISLTLHYRHGGQEYWTSPEGERWLRERGAGVRLIPGKMCWNLVPAGMSKGQATLRYCQERNIGRLIYFGDEPTDETVFELKEIEVVGVKVGDEEDVPTAARFTVPDVAGVLAWLAQLS
jgi:trehalose 6-phosphate phosphatase